MPDDGFFKNLFSFSVCFSRNLRQTPMTTTLRLLCFRFVSRLGLSVSILWGGTTVFLSGWSSSGARLVLHPPRVRLDTLVLFDI